MTEDELREIEAREHKATPGPWIEGGRGLDNLDANGLPIEYDAVYPEDEDQENDCIARDVIHDDCKFIAAANPETIKQLITLVRLQHEAIDGYGKTGYWNTDILENAIAAFNKFEGGE